MKVNGHLTLMLITFVIIGACKKNVPENTAIEEPSMAIPVSSFTEYQVDDTVKIIFEKGYTILKDIQTNMDDDLDDERIILYNTNESVLCRDSISQCLDLAVHIYERDSARWVETFAQKGGFLWPLQESLKGNNGFRDLVVYNKQIEITHSEGNLDDRTYHKNRYQYSNGECNLISSQVRNYSTNQPISSNNKTSTYKLNLKDSTVTIENKHEGLEGVEIMKKTFMFADTFNSTTFFNPLEVQDSFMVLPRNLPLFDILLHLPSEASLVHGEETLKMIDRATEGNNAIRPSKDIFYAIKEYDHENKYIEIHGAFDGQWSMRYWTKEKGREVVAVLKTSCAPLCVVEYLRFYEYDGNKIQKIQRPEISELSYTDFFNLSPQDFENTINNNDIQISILFELPKTGKNIHAVLNNQHNEVGSDFDKHLKKYQKGTRIPFIYNNGRFTKGKIY